MQHLKYAFTRRFGLAGGLVWLGILTFGVVSEQIKTRLEDRAEQRDTKVRAFSSYMQLVYER